MTIRARQPIDDVTISRTLLSRGFDCPALSRYYRGRERRSGFILGFGASVHVGRDVIDTLAPGLTDTPEAFDRWRERLVMYARAMVEAERARRAAAPQRPARRGAQR